MKDASKNKQPSQDIFNVAEIQVKCVGWYRCINTILKLCTLPATVFIHTLLSSKLGICAKLSQAKVLTGGRGIARSAIGRSPIFAIPSFDRVAGLCNRHRNSNKGICLH